MKWKFGERKGQIIAGGNRVDLLSHPTDIIVDHRTNSLIVCDWGNRKVLRWSITDPNDREVLISDIRCYGLMMNENGDLFVSDRDKHEVKRWRKGEKEGTTVAGGNGRGDQLNQLDSPAYIFIDGNETVYVSDCNNHRVMKWIKDAKEGIVVAGGHGQGDSLKQLNYPCGLLVIDAGDVYVADNLNHRVMCWPLGSREGHVIVGGNGQKSNQLNYVRGLSLDVNNNLYVADLWNHRIQRFDIDEN